MNAKKKSTTSIWTDQDDAPELNESFFDKADLYAGKTLKARGRPKSAEQLATSYLRKGKLKRTSKHCEADIKALKKKPVRPWTNCLRRKPWIWSLWLQTSKRREKKS